jgi:biofilm PGA synthesis N-glycosyltransferase PgaC
LIFYSLLIILSVYAAVLFWLARGFSKTPVFSISEECPSIPLTIIICARNEEKTIARCLKTIVQQDYDLTKVQIIIINDASGDSTVIQAQAVLKNSGIDFKIISNQTQKGKKESISYAVQFAGHDLIVLRDADTYTKSYSWLKSISDFYTEKKSDMVIGPVAISDNSGSLWAIQAIENNVLSIFNAGSAYYKKAFLCSGANLIFTKAIFKKTNGFNGHINIASGDDILFLEDVKKIPGAKIDFLKCEDAIVYTYPCFSFKSLLRQKTRWASKFRVNNNKLNLTLAFLSVTVNASWLYCLFYGFFMPQIGALSLIFVLFKLVIDILLLFLASSFLKNKAIVWYILPIGLIYPIYSCIIAISTVFLKPKWK